MWICQYLLKLLDWLLWGPELEISLENRVKAITVKVLTLVAQSLSLSLSLALLGPPPPGARAICSPIDLILACLQRPHQGANCKDGSGFQHLSTRNWTYTPNSFHAATRQTSDGSNFWSLLSRSGTWCPTTPCDRFPVFQIFIGVWNLNVDYKSKQNLRETLPEL